MARFGAQFVDPAAPHQATPQWERQPPWIIDIAHHGRHFRQAMCAGAGQQFLQNVGTARAAVVVGKPDPIGAQGERVEHAQRESSCTAEVSVRSQVGGRDGLTLDQCLDGGVVVVVHHHKVVRGDGLRGDYLQRLRQFAARR